MEGKASELSKEVVKAQHDGEDATIDDKGRVHLSNEQSNVDKEDDPFAPVFEIIEKIQEAALPLIFGVVLAMILANAAPEWYKYNFTSAHHAGGHAEEPAAAGNSTARFLAAGGGGGTYPNPQADVCLADCEHLKVDRLLLLPWTIFGHPVTLHFFANDMIMVFHFGLAVKEVTEALLPGGSLNPPSKATNPILATMGGVLGPVSVFFILLTAFKSAGIFDDTYSFEALSKGWGIVTATDIPLAWLAALVVYGVGHPAIDYLLLLAVADDALGMVIIAVFYTDPASPVQPQWLGLVVAAMVLAYCLRKWHYRKERVNHQSWQPYVLICGVMSWVGLIKAKLHPALALVPIVPFMPGPNHSNLEHLDESIEEKLEDKIDGGDGSGARSRGNTAQADDTTAHILEKHYNNARGRGVTIQAGLYAGLVGHTVPDALKVEEYDEDGNVHLNASTLDSFEHFWKVYVDFGLFLFALCNAGVQIKGAPGGMTWLILLSLIIGKYLGIMFFFKISKKVLGYPAPLGIRTRHIRMIGLIASLGLTVALFVSDVAFTDDKLKDDARLGALLSGFIGFLCYAISLKFDFAAEDVSAEIKTQLEEEINEEGGSRAAPATLKMGVMTSGDSANADDGAMVTKTSGDAQVI